VNVGTTTRLSATLSVAAVKQETTVDAPTAPQLLIDNTNSAVSTVVDERAIDVLPLNGRDFVDFVLLIPGSVTDGDFGMISFNGIAGNFNNYTVDGGNNNNAFYSQQIGRTSIPYQFSQDVIKEFQVTNAGFEPSSARQEGGWSTLLPKTAAITFMATLTITAWTRPQRERFHQQGQRHCQTEQQAPAVRRHPQRPHPA